MSRKKNFLIYVLYPIIELELFYSNAPEHFRELEHAHRRLFRNLIDYASAQNLSLAVASKTREFDLQNTELDYFRSIAGEFDFQFIRGDKSTHEFDTYRAGLASDLVVDLSSTLGFELLSAGTKVLFGASQEPHLITQWGIEHYFDILPDAVKLKSSSKKEFFRTCDRIRRDVGYSIRESHSGSRTSHRYNVRSRISP